MLDKQVQILSVDTGNFYSNKEARLHWLNHKLRNERKQLIDGYTIKGSDNKCTRKITGRKELEKRLNEIGINEQDLSLIENAQYNFSKFAEREDEVKSLCDEYHRLKKIIAFKNEQIKNVKNALLKLLEDKVDANIKTNGKHHIRVLRENKVSSKDVISVAAAVGGFLSV